MYNQLGIETMYNSKLSLQRVKLEYFFRYPNLPNHNLNLYYLDAISDFGLNNLSSTDRVIRAAKSSHIETSKKRILIVDDEADIARFFKLALEHAGFIVDVFNYPIKSLSNYTAGTYDLLLLDIRMPQMSGFELYDKIKAIDDNVNVYFVTAFEEYYDEFKERFPHSDKTEWFIRKPIGVEELILKVKSRLNYN
jgi:CheY-like chemotaxis protein